MHPETQRPEPIRKGPQVWEIPSHAGEEMRVPARVFASAELMEQIGRDRSLQQLVNVSTLPGLAAPVMGMPDMHEGYGFPVGGVAATRYPEGVISPGGIGFDINCGVRLLATSLRREEVEPHLGALLHEIARSVPSGYGRGSRELSFSGPKLDRILEEGVRHLVSQYGIGSEEELPFIESGGTIPGAKASVVSDRAKERGKDQLGTLGGGNHFLEIQYIERIYDRALAKAFGLGEEGQITVLIHTGSRGLGHQVCTDYVKRMDAAMHAYGIQVPDRQLACAPLDAPEGRAYFAAMSAAANFAFCNRHVIAHRIRRAFAYILGSRGLGERAEALDTVYDVAHNIAKLERFGDEVFCVHRKGATRAFGPSAGELPAPYRGFGQPVFIPGSMGTYSYVLAGRDEAKELSLASSCHGAGRAMSRAAAKRKVSGAELRRELGARGILVEGASNKELAEEAPAAYKDVDAVVDVVHEAGIATKVARVRPIAVRKG